MGLLIDRIEIGSGGLYLGHSLLLNRTGRGHYGYPQLLDARDYLQQFGIIIGVHVLVLAHSEVYQVDAGVLEVGGQ